MITMILIALGLLIAVEAVSLWKLVISHRTSLLTYRHNQVIWEKELRHAQEKAREWELAYQKAAKGKFDPGFVITADGIKMLPANWQDAMAKLVEAPK